jgi:hypothetical protein
MRKYNMGHARRKLDNLKRVWAYLLVHPGSTIRQIQKFAVDGAMHRSTVYRYLADLGAFSPAGSYEWFLYPNEDDLALAEAILTSHKINRDRYPSAIPQEGQARKQGEEEMSTLREILESGIAYDAQWGIWADAGSGLHAESAARIGQMQFVGGGRNDGYKFIVDGQRLGDMIFREESNFRADYEREHGTMPYIATKEYEEAWKEFYKYEVVDYLVEALG